MVYFMSKAFTREDDDAPEQPLRIEKALSLPPGANNYLTKDGAQRFEEELARLLHEGADSQPRIHEIQQILQSAVVVSPPEDEDRVRFGATVTVCDRQGKKSIYRIVGLDETDPDQGWVSWLSPVAKALLNARLGQWVRLELPSGAEELEVAAISYR
jgi:transcription elongation factor GreB